MEYFLKYVDKPISKLQENQGNNVIIILTWLNYPLVAMRAPPLCDAPVPPLAEAPAAAPGPPRPLQPGLGHQLHHGQDLGHSQQSQHHEDQQVSRRRDHTGEIQTEERARSESLPKIFPKKIAHRDG